MNAEDLVKISCVRHIYPDQREVFLCGLDFVVDFGERVAILGPSGSGKTTLLKHILGLLKPTEGTVRVFGVDPTREFSKIRERFGFVMQDVEEQLTQPTVYDEVAFGPRNFGYKEPEVKTMVFEVLKLLGIYDLNPRLPQYLSGGEKQKVALASALVLKPQLLLLDEPFEGIDLQTRRELIALLNALWRAQHFALVFTLHDVNIVPQLADSVYLMKHGGEISKRGTPEEIFAHEEELKEYHLEPPMLFQIFRELQKIHPSLIIPRSTEEALEMLRQIKRDAS